MAQAGGCPSEELWLLGAVRQTDGQTDQFFAASVDERLEAPPGLRPEPLPWFITEAARLNPASAGRNGLVEIPRLSCRLLLCSHNTMNL